MMPDLKFINMCHFQAEPVIKLISVIDNDVKARMQLITQETVIFFCVNSVLNFSLSEAEHQRATPLIKMHCFYILKRLSVCSFLFLSVRFYRQ
jgi:hypothetical protein